jgi:glycosyltransferase involved in cell wall biosynthesis
VREAKSSVHNIRVAVVVPGHWDFSMGGSEYQAKLLIEVLHQKFGADIAYFAAKVGDKRDFSDHRVIRSGRTTSLRKYGHFWDYFSLQRALGEFAPDVIYQRVSCAYTGIAARYATRCGVPLIWHISSDKVCAEPPGIGQFFRRPHAIIETYLANWGAARADLVVAQTKDQAKMLVENFGRGVDKLVRNFHPLPPVAEKHGDRFRVVWIANLKALKRPGLFLEIAALLSDMPGVEFLVVGKPYGSGTEQSRFEELVNQQSNVRYLGPVAQDDANQLLEQSHLLLNTSKWEGFPNTFIQAWMRSVPVITLGVNPEGLLDDSYLGFSHDSVNDAADSIRRLFANPDTLANMGKKCRQFAAQNFSMKNALELAGLIADTAIEQSEDFAAIRER